MFSELLNTFCNTGVKAVAHPHAQSTGDLEYMTDGMVDFDAEVRHFESLRPQSSPNAGTPPSQRAATPTRSLPHTLEPRADRPSQTTPLASATEQPAASHVERPRAEFSHPTEQPQPQQQQLHTNQVTPPRMFLSRGGGKSATRSSRENDASRGNRSPTQADVDRPSSKSVTEAVTVTNVTVGPERLRGGEVRTVAAATVAATITQPPTQGGGGDFAALASRVAALEVQAAGMNTLRELVRELQRSVETLSSRQSDIQGDVAEHCSHSSSLLTAMQVRLLLVFLYTTSSASFFISNLYIFWILRYR